ncbi:rod shape-determining protein MreD [Nonomuraea composti]|uniref:rod shape-determining protein MreD n=1 Tax=Nonomuraea composti TaxID=2720023 RepID=UPI001F113D51|nr:rod shape-determining protein MreD [Nonomuraea sp. FMUSA5-5]
MRIRVAAAVALAPLLQVAILERLPVRPDLVMLVAVTAGLARGPNAGAVTGFAVGLLADLVPPAPPPVGRTALLLCLLGYGMGLLGGRLRDGGTGLRDAGTGLGNVGTGLRSVGTGLGGRGTRFPGRPRDRGLTPRWATALIGAAAGSLAATAYALLLDGLPEHAGLLLDGWPGRAPLAALPFNLLAGPLVWLLIAGRGRAPFRRHSDATFSTLPAAAGARAGGSAVPRPARPALAGADPGRRAVHGRGGRRPRTPRRRPGGSRAHPR